MNFHGVSKGVAIYFGSKAGGGMFELFDKIIKNFPCSLRSLGFYKLNSYQAT